MQKEPFVSVLIANYNNSSYIQQCINSLNSQTYKNLEIIFFDDNSSDNSLEIIKKFSNVKIIENKIQTKFGSLNQLNAFRKGIKISKGDVIFLLDSDDYFKYEKVVAGIIPLRTFKNDFIPASIKINSREKDALEIKPSTLNNFEKELFNLILEIFDPSVPIVEKTI